MRFRPVLPLLLVLIVSIWGMANTCLAVTLSVGDGSENGFIGEEIQIDIVVDDSTGIVGAAFTLEFDDSLDIEVSSDFFGTFQKQLAHLDPPEPDPVVDGETYLQPLLFEPDEPDGSGITTLRIAAARAMPATVAETETLFTLTITGTESGSFDLTVVQTQIGGLDLPMLIGANLDISDPSDSAAFPLLLDLASGEGQVEDGVVEVINQPPTITDIADQSTDEDTPVGPIAFTVGDVETAAASLTVSATSNNQTLVPDDNITLAGADENRTLTVSPASDESGSAVITVSVSDGIDSATDTFTVTVTAANDAPTVSDIADQSSEEDTPVGPIAFTIGDVETAAASLTVSATSNNQTLVPDDNITLAGADENRTLTVSPAADESGSAVITVSVSDGIDSATDTFTVTVTAANDAPTVSDIADQSTEEDTPVGPIAFTVGDVETAAASLTVSATSDNQTLVPDDNITLAGADENRTLTVTPAADESGSAVITVSVSDGIDSATDTFTVTVTAANDAPTVSDIADQGTDEDTPVGPIAFTVGDVESDASSLTVSATSDNQTLVPDDNITLAGADENRTLTVSPAADESGSALITVSVSDGNDSATDTFTVTVTSANDAPTVSDIGNQGTDEDTPVGPIAFTVGDVESDASSLTVSATSNNQTLVPDDNITLAGAGENRTLTVSPAADESGAVVITVSVSDSIDSATDTFTVTVTAVNDAPSGTDNSITVAEDGSYVLSAVDFGFSDPLDSPSNALSQVRITQTPALGTLWLGAVAVNNDQEIEETDIAAGSLQYTPPSSASGMALAEFTFAVIDDGPVGDSNVNEDQTPNTIVIDVTPVDDPPVISDIPDQSIDEDVALTLNFTADEGGGPDEDGQTVTVVSATSSDLSVVANDGISILFSDGAGDATGGGITITPVSQANGTTTITVTVSDGTTSASDDFVLTVTAVNDTPVANAQTVTATEDVEKAITLSGEDGDPEIAQALSYILTQLPATGRISQTPGGAAIGTVPTPLTGATVYFKTAANDVSTQSFAFQVKDNGGGSDTSDEAVVAVNVTPVNDPPVLVNPGNKSVAEGQPLTFVLSATDPDGQNVTYSSESLPTGATLNATTGEFLWTPGAEQEGNYQVTFKATEDNGPASLSDEETINISVGDVNRPPVLGGIEDLAYTEGDGAVAVSAGITASDQDAGAVLTSAAISLTGGYVPAEDQLTCLDPRGLTAAWDAGSGILALTGSASIATYQAALRSVTYTNLSDTPAAAARTVSWVVNDGIDSSVELTSVITVAPVNDAPVITIGENLTVQEDSGPRAFVGWASGIGTVEPEQSLVISVSTNNDALFAQLPELTTDGELTFTPADDANGSAEVTVTLTDNGGTASGGADTTLKMFTITVTPVNDAPTSVSLSNSSILENVAPGTVVGLLSNEDVDDGDTHVYSLVEGEGDSGNAFFDIEETDDGFALKAKAAFDYEAGPSYSLRVQARDAGDLFIEKSFEITVVNVNEAPPVANFTAPATEGGAVVTGSVAVVDPDGDVLSYALSGAAPAGLTFNADGSFSFDPADAAYDGLKAGETTDVVAGFAVSGDAGGPYTADLTITVTGVNDAPALSAIGAQTVQEESTLTITPSATDPDGEAVITSIDGALPSGAAFAGGVFNWTPTIDQSGTYAVTFVATDDDADNPLADSETVSIEVTKKNRAPALSAIGAQSVQEESTLTITPSATDPDGDTVIIKHRRCAAIRGGVCWRCVQLDADDRSVGHVRGDVCCHRRRCGQSADRQRDGEHRGHEEEPGAGAVCHRHTVGAGRKHADDHAERDGPGRRHRHHQHRRCAAIRGGVCWRCVQLDADDRSVGHVRGDVCCHRRRCGQSADRQ
jgi:VCBS repeat-containing protein